MSARLGTQTYLQTQVGSATPLELVVILYDGALRSANAAYDAMVRRDIPARRSALNRLLEIIAELQGSLNLERGGQIAAELDGLYTYLVSRVIAAITSQDPKPIGEVRRILETLRDAWQQLNAQTHVVAAGSGRP